MSEKEAGSVITSANAEEFYANKLGLAEQAPIEAEVETPKQEVDTTEPTEEAEVQSESETTEKEIETKATEEKKPNPKLEKRFSEITKARKLAEEKLAKERESREAAEAKIKEYEAKFNPQPELNQMDESLKPKPEQFNDAFEYAEALADWKVDEKFLIIEKQETERKFQEQQQQIIKSWNDRLVNVKADLPDYDEMIASAADITVSNELRDAMLESEQGPRILYHLAENPELAEKLKSMSIVSAVREIGKLEAKFEASETPKEAKTEAETKPSIARSKAPAPISPIKTSSAVADVGVGADGEFHGTYQQWRNSRKAGKIR
jgi:hypothetical protein